MDAPTPPLPVGVRPMAQAGDQLIADLERFWDADFGALRDAAAGQRVELAFAMLEPFWFLPDPPPWVEALKDEARRRYSRRGAALRREDPPGAYLFGGTSARGLRSWLAERQAELDGEDWNVWTQDQARVLQQVAVALGARPNKGLATDLTRYAEALAARVEAQVEPTWRWQAFRRPIKTFKANPDVAQPHAEVVLGLLAAARALKDGGWLEDVAAAQGAHLLDAHAADGAPPSWVMGAWKERARFETPCRIGTALDGLAELRGEAKVRQRADQLRRLTWQRYLASRDSLETRERVFLLRWLAPTPGI